MIWVDYGFSWLLDTRRCGLCHWIYDSFKNSHPQTQSRHTIYIHAPNHDTAVIDVFCDDVGDISTAWAVRAGT